MNVKPNPNNQYRAALKDALETRTPDEWVSMLNKLIHDDLTRFWVASTMLHCWRSGKAYGTSLDTLASNYKDELNTRNETDKQAAYEVLGLPFFRVKSDNSTPREVRGRAMNKTSKTKRGRPPREAYKYCKYHQIEAGRAG